MDKITLNNGNKIPSVGFGVFMIPNGKDTFEAVLKAFVVYHDFETGGFMPQCLYCDGVIL